jgi:hypothetical protein
MAAISSSVRMLSSSHEFLSSNVRVQQSAAENQGRVIP